MAGMMLCCNNLLQALSRQRLSPRPSIRFYHRTFQRFEDKNSGVDESKLKWTEKKEAPKWLNRMAPTKGGTQLPTPKEAAVIAVVAAAGYYAWFVAEPPRPVSADKGGT